MLCYYVVWVWSYWVLNLLPNQTVVLTVNIQLWNEQNFYDKIIIYLSQTLLNTLTLTLLMISFLLYLCENHATFNQIPVRPLEIIIRFSHINILFSKLIHPVGCKRVLCPQWLLLANGCSYNLWFFFFIGSLFWFLP